MSEVEFKDIPGVESYVVVRPEKPKGMLKKILAKIDAVKGKPFVIVKETQTIPRPYDGEGR